jgi:hypothetical protein
MNVIDERYYLTLNMSTTISSPVVISTKQIRPSTPIRRRCLAPLQCNINTEHALLDLIDRIKDSTDSSTQLLIRLYHYKSIRLNDQREKLYSFQQEIYAGLRRLHPSIITSTSSNQVIKNPQPTITCRSAQATIRKLH